MPLNQLCEGNQCLICVEESFNANLKNRIVLFWDTIMKIRADLAVGISRFLLHAGVKSLCHYEFLLAINLYYYVAISC